MKKILIIGVLIFAMNLQGEAQKQSFICNYYGKAVNEKAICNIFGFRTRPEAIEAVEKIVKRSGLKQNFYVMECPNIDNCFAVTRDGERLIVYDSSFMRRINNMTNTDWGAISVLAHEIGHHLQGHTLKQGGSDQEKELEADEFSGFVMYQMGASVKEAQSAINKLTTDYDGGTHPPRSSRLKAIATGYSNAKALYPSIGERTSANERVKTEEIDEESKAEPNENKNIKTGCVSGDCSFGYGVAVNRYTYEKYAGNWKNGNREGKGFEFYASNEKKYEGDFKNGLYHGIGRYYFKNGDYYEGGFKEGNMNGKSGKYFYKNGDILYVDYINGKKEGIGKMVFRDGSSRKVIFKNDELIK